MATKAKLLTQVTKGWQNYLTYMEKMKTDLTNIGKLTVIKVMKKTTLVKNAYDGYFGKF